MKRPALITFASLLLFVGWTSTSQSEWFKGIIYAGSGKVQLTDATGNLMSAGSFAASGAVGVGGALSVTGATSLASTLSVTGAQTNSSSLQVAGALGVTGAATLRSTLAVSGASTFSGAISGTGATLTGPVTLSNAAVSLTSISAGVTADVSSVQGGGAMTTLVVEVTTAAVAGDAITLPSAVAGLTAIVANHAAANAIDVFPAASDQINNVAVNGAISLAAGEGMFCIAATAVRWICVIGSAT
jgi:hypothetical protein